MLFSNRETKTEETYFVVNLHNFLEFDNYPSAFCRFPLYIFFSLHGLLLGLKFITQKLFIYDMQKFTSPSNIWWAANSISTIEPSFSSETVMLMKPNT